MAAELTLAAAWALRRWSLALGGESIRAGREVGAAEEAVNLVTGTSGEEERVRQGHLRALSLAAIGSSDL